MAKVRQGVGSVFVHLEDGTEHVYKDGDEVKPEHAKQLGEHIFEPEKKQEQKKADDK